jgi:uncharacterized secreted protein with C-terminal beta-propeller domain
MVLSCSVVCPCCRSWVNSSCCSLFSCVIVTGHVWKVAARLWMFFIVRRLSSMNLCGRMLSSRLSCGKLYLVVVMVYCGC